MTYYDLKKAKEFKRIVMMTEKINRQPLVYIYLKLHIIDMTIYIFGVIMLPLRAKDYLTKLQNWVQETSFKVVGYWESKNLPNYCMLLLLLLVTYQS